MPALQIKLCFDDGTRIGPGKVELLEQIHACGSISAAGRQMGMSYKRAWDLIAAMNRMFGGPVVSPKTGGTGGGGAELTLGFELVKQFRTLEAAAAKAAAPHTGSLQSMRAPAEGAAKRPKN